METGLVFYGPILLESSEIRIAGTEPVDIHRDY